MIVAGPTDCARVGGEKLTTRENKITHASEILILRLLDGMIICSQAE
jgi:hypothetical protein